MDSINQSVIEKLRSRAELGAKKYGVTMDRTDFTELQWLQYLQEELMDGAVYLEKLIRLNGTCKWYVGNRKSHTTACEHACTGFEFEGFEFCPFCGRKIEEVK